MVKKCLQKIRAIRAIRAIRGFKIESLISTSEFGFKLPGCLWLSYPTLVAVPEVLPRYVQSKQYWAFRSSAELAERLDSDRAQEL